MRLTKTVVTGSVLALAFLANCDLITGPSWKYGEADMRAAVEGTWKLTRNGETITLVAKQASGAKHSARETGFVKDAAACGNRSFIKEAAACIDSSELPLEITADKHAIEDAAFVVHSTRFDSGTLRFTIDDASVDARVDPSGKVEQVSMWMRGKNRFETVTLERIAK